MTQLTSRAPPDHPDVIICPRHVLRLIKFSRPVKTSLRLPTRLGRLSNITPKTFYCPWVMTGMYSLGPFLHAGHTVVVTFHTSQLPTRDHDTRSLTADINKSSSNLDLCAPIPHVEQRTCKDNANLAMQLPENLTIIEMGFIGTDVPKCKRCLETVFVSEQPVAEINQDLFKITSEELLAWYALISQKTDLLSKAASYIEEST